MSSRLAPVHVFSSLYIYILLNTQKSGWSRSDDMKMVYGSLNVSFWLVFRQLKRMLLVHALSSGLHANNDEPHDADAVACNAKYHFAKYKTQYFAACAHTRPCVPASQREEERCSESTIVCSQVSLSWLNYATDLMLWIFQKGIICEAEWIFCVAMRFCWQRTTTHTHCHIKAHYARCSVCYYFRIKFIFDLVCAALFHLAVGILSRKTSTLFLLCIFSAHFRLSPIVAIIRAETKKKTLVSGKV